MLKSYKPVTPSLRSRRIVDTSKLYKGSSVKRLSRFKKSIDGKNHHGRTTVYHRGGGHRRLYRQLYLKVIGSYTILRIEYDPNRSGHIALILHNGDQLSYIPCSKDMEIGEKRTGARKLADHNLWDKIHNLSLYPNQRSQYIRAAGASGRLVGKNAYEGYAEVQLPSKEIIRLPMDATAESGQVSNASHQFINLGGAGYNRKLGRRPVVRGVAMNPIDHPHGGGEGRSSGGRPSVTPWGKITKGQPTVGKRREKQRSWFRKVSARTKNK